MVCAGFAALHTLTEVQVKGGDSSDLLFFGFQTPHLQFAMIQPLDS